MAEAGSEPQCACLLSLYSSLGLSFPFCPMEGPQLKEGLGPELHGGGATNLPDQGVVKRRDVHPTIPLGQLLRLQTGLIPDLKRSEGLRSPRNWTAVEAGAEPEVSCLAPGSDGLGRTPRVRPELGWARQPPQSKSEASSRVSRCHVLSAIPTGWPAVVGEGELQGQLSSFSASNQPIGEKPPEIRAPNSNLAPTDGVHENQRLPSG